AHNSGIPAGSCSPRRDPDGHDSAVPSPEGSGKPVGERHRRIDDDRRSAALACCSGAAALLLRVLQRHRNCDHFSDRLVRMEVGQPSACPFRPGPDVSPRSRGPMTTAFEGDAKMDSPKRLARIAGALYLLVGIFGGFAQGYVEPKVYVAGNAAATARDVVANAGLVRAGVVAELFDSTIFVFLAMTLYVLLNHVHRSMARAMLVLVALSAGISCLN